MRQKGCSMLLTRVACDAVPGRAHAHQQRRRLSGADGPPPVLPLQRGGLQGDRAPKIALRQGILGGAHDRGNLSSANISSAKFSSAGGLQSAGLCGRGKAAPVAAHIVEACSQRPTDECLRRLLSGLSAGHPCRKLAIALRSAAERALALLSADMF